jgi:hypothetical protein
MQLSKNFTLEELTVTNTGLSNIPNEEQKRKLLYVAQYLLQPIRDEFGEIHVNSGFRSDLVNEKIGGSKTSQHPEGEATDFRPKLEADLVNVFKWCRENLTFGQLIFEHKGDVWWIHISLPRLDKPNMMVMKFENGVYTNI